MRKDLVKKKFKKPKHEDFPLWEYFDYAELDHCDRLDWLTLKTRTILFNGEVTEELCDWTSKSLVILGAISNDPIHIIINTASCDRYNRRPKSKGH